MASDGDRQKRIQLIVQIARERLKLNPNDVDALFTMAAAQGTLNDAEGGVRSLERLAKLNPNYPGLWVLKAKLHARLGQADLAQQSRLRAAQAGPDMAGLSASPCPMCETLVPDDATKCPNCGVEFAPTSELEDELDQLGHAAIQEIVQEEFKEEVGASPLEETPMPVIPVPKPARPLPAGGQPLGAAQAPGGSRPAATNDGVGAAASSADRTSCPSCGSSVPAGAAACPVCNRPVGRERDLVQELDTLVDSVLGEEAPGTGVSTEATPQMWEELGAIAAVEPKLSLEPEAAAVPPQRKRRADDRTTGRGRADSSEKPRSEGRARRSFASSAFVRFGLPIAVAAAIVLIPLMLLTGGPWGPGQDQNIASATPQINGLNLNPSYGDVVGGSQFSFTVTVAQNSYLVAKDIRPVIAATNLTGGTDVVLNASFDGVTYTLTSPTVTQQGSTFYYDFGTSFQRSVGARTTGASAPTWYFQFRYAVSNLQASVVTWNAQFATG